jgi:hypothetical protein
MRQCVIAIAWRIGPKKSGTVGFWRGTEHRPLARMTAELADHRRLALTRKPRPAISDTHPLVVLPGMRCNHSHNDAGCD